MASLEQAVLEYPLFRGLEQRVGALVAGCARNARFEPGEFLFREGAEADEFFLVRAGVVALESHAPGQAPVIVLTVGAGELVGFSWLVPPYRWRFDARALEQTRAIGVNVRCLRAKWQSDHDLGYELLNRLAGLLLQRLHATRLQLLDVYRSPAP